ncbi:MAG: MlaD family protein, partial [Chloroflexi bacterium]|nr:MlaD family protein [Chloroflexota bacterium]
MSRRIVINLVFFAAIGVALAVWAVTNVISFDFVERPYRVTAEFATSPGLSPYFEVTYLGQKVGAIDSVDLDDGMVRVQLEIERSISLPAAVDAYVRRKSAVGEPYVDLVPSPDTDPATGARLAGGDVIPLSRTFTPLAYSDLFLALDELVAAIPPDALRTLLHELAVGLEGRGESLRSIVEGADELTSSLAANVDLLDAFLSELTRLTHTFAGHRESVTGAVD